MMIFRFHRTLTFTLIVLASLSVQQSAAQMPRGVVEPKPDKPAYQKDNLWWRRVNGQEQYHTGKRWVPYIASDGSKGFNEVWQQILRTMSRDPKVREAAAKALGEERRRKHVKPA